MEQCLRDQYTFWLEWGGGGNNPKKNLYARKNVKKKLNKMKQKKKIMEQIERKFFQDAIVKNSCSEELLHSMSVPGGN